MDDRHDEHRQRSKAVFDMKIALNAEIQSQCYPDDDELTSVVHAPASVAVPVKSRHLPTSIVPYTEPVKAKQSSIANKTMTEWNVGSDEQGGGKFQEVWPSHLPRPPSMRQLNHNETSGDSSNTSAVSVIVFNANTQEGSSMVRVMSDKGLNVVAVVRVATSRNTKQLVKLKNVTVRVADLHNHDAVVSAASGCVQAFLVTKYWERFENYIEEDMAKVVLRGSAQAGIKRLVFATFEDTIELRARNRKSQIIPTADGRIYPKFDSSMNTIIEMAKPLGVSVTNMMTSYLDEPTCKKSLILIRNEQGKIITQPYIQEITPSSTPSRGKSSIINTPAVKAVG